LADYDAPGLSKQSYQSALVQQPLGAPLFELAHFFGIQGPKLQVSSSCSASLQAIAVGQLWIESGFVDRCVVGSTEIHNDLTRLGFNSLRLLSKSNCTPFDRNRNGINLGEGAAFLCLEKHQRSNRNVKSWGFVSGAGLTSDAYHPTAPHPQGQGSLDAMKKAFIDSGLPSLKEIPWIYAHGTGSQANDSAEAHAIESYFSAVHPFIPYVTSTKSLHGHTLGACGALESVIGLYAMKESVILPNHYLNEPDPLISLQLPKEPKTVPFSHFMKNSLGFGGINVSVIFSKELHGTAI
jgi:3-oxoacyl-[acyl-carrier-protein] synthase-1